MIGSRLGAYSIVSDLGAGGMGKVYLAEVAGKVPGIDDGSRVALKVIHTHLLETPGFFKRFLREAQIGQDVQHENVVRCFDCDATLLDGASQHFLVMEYVEGQTLRELLQELERVPEELCRHIGREVAKGLAAIHAAGVVHRDLKPENVLITDDHAVKIMDLGVARLQDEAMRLSQTGAFVGSLEYAAPEQFQTADGDPDGRADLHALGVLLYELATGQHPFRADDASKVLRNILDTVPRKAGEVNPQLSPFFEEAVQTLLAKDRADRFAAASEFAEVIEEGEESDWWKERAKALRIETKRPLRRIRIPRETALYGRDDDLAKLRSLYEKAKEGDGQVLLIEGEAGIGKTRLVDEFVGRLRQEGEDINFLFGSYPPGGAATASGAFSTAYREQFGAEGLADTLQTYLTATPVLIPSFAALLRGETMPTGAEPLTKDSLQTVFVHATRALAAERPTIVLIDDLHFAPEDGRALFASLAHAAPGHRLLLLGTMRPGVREDWTANVTRLDQAEQRFLSRLGPKDLSHLLKDAFRSERLARELGIQIAEKSDGNPFFAFEIIRGLREGQFIGQQPDGTWVTTKVIQDIQVPSSVIDLVHARIQDLSEDDKDLLDVACCCGFEFDPGLVAHALGAPRLPTLKRLGRIEHGRRLIRSTGRTYRFDHHQVQESLYAALHEQLREEYHGAIAESQEMRAGAAECDPEDLDGDLCVDLVEHFLRSGDARRALRYLEAALAHLKRAHLARQALSLLQRTLQAEGVVQGERRVRTLLQQVSLLQLLGRRSEHMAALEEARHLARACAAEELLLLVDSAQADFYALMGRHAEARTIYEGALARARRQEDLAAEARAVHGLCTVAIREGEFGEAREHARRLSVLGRELGDPQQVMYGIGNLGYIDLRQDRFNDARTHFERRLAFAQEVGDRLAQAWTLGMLGQVATSESRYDEAQIRIERSLALSRELGARDQEMHTVGNLGVVFAERGELSVAQERYLEQLQLARELGDTGSEAAVLINLSNVAAAQGRLDEAKGLLKQSLDIARTHGHRNPEVIAVGNLASHCMLEGRLEEALKHLDSCLRLARDLGGRIMELQALLGQAQLASRLGRHGYLRECLDEALRLARESGAPRSLFGVVKLLGFVHLEAGELEDAERVLEEALEIARGASLRPEEASALVSKGLLLAEVGRIEEAIGCFEEAGRMGRELSQPRTTVIAAVARALLPGGAIDDAVRLYREQEAALGRVQRTELLWWLHQSTGDPRFLREAKQGVDHAVQHAPEEYRESMLVNVRLHREIMEAWEEHGEKAGKGTDE